VEEGETVKLPCLHTERKRFAKGMCRSCYSRGRKNKAAIARRLEKHPGEGAFGGRVLGTESLWIPGAGWDDDEIESLVRDLRR
jgi:hypothetical protein